MQTYITILVGSWNLIVYHRSSPEFVDIQGISKSQELSAVDAILPPHSATLATSEATAQVSPGHVLNGGINWRMKQLEK